MVETEQYSQSSNLATQILLVSANPDHQQTFGDLLRAAGYGVVSANTAGALWEQWEAGQTGERSPVGLVVLDATALEPGALELLQQLKADSRAAMVPVIVLAAAEDQAVLESLVAAGAHDFLLQPWRPAELLTRIQAARRRGAASWPALRRLERLVEAGQLLISTLDLEEVLRRILEMMEAELDAEAGSVWLPAPDGSLVCYIAVKGGGERLLGMRIEPGQGIAGWVLQHQRATLVPDAQEDPRFYRRSDEVSQYRTRSVAAVPMVVKGIGVGVLEVVNKRQGTFTPEDLAWLEALVPLATAAIENARLFRREKRTARYLHALSQAVTTASAGLHWEQIPSAVVQTLVHECDLAHAALWLAPTPGAPLVLQAKAGAPLEEPLSAAHPLPPYVEAVVSEQRPLILNRLEHEAGRLYRRAKEGGMAAFAGYPLAGEKGLRGVLTLFSTEPLETETLNMLSVFARELAILLENTDLLQQVQRRNQELTILHRISELAFQASSLEVAGQAIIQEIGRALDFPFAAIELYDPDRQTLIFKWAYGLKVPLEVPITHSPAGMVVTTGRAFCQFNVQNTNHLHPALRKTGANTYIGLPMLVDQQVLGVLSLAHTEPVQVDERFLQWANSLAGYLAALIKRHEAELALQENERKFRALTENTTAAILIHRGGQCLYVNPALAAITGYFLEELYTMNFWELIHPDQREQVKTRSLARLQGQMEPARYQTQLITKTGQTRWIDLTAMVIPYEGRPAVLWTFQDITSHKELEAALQASELRYRYISELTSDYAYVLRLEDGRVAIEWLSESCRQLMGLPSTVVPSQPQLLEFVFPADREQALQQLRTVLTGEAAVAEFRILLPSGEIRTLNNLQRPIWDAAHQRVIRVYGAAQDITERKRIEAEQHQLTAQLRAAAELVEHINAILDSQRLLPEIVTQLRIRFGFPRVALYLLQPASQRLALQLVSAADGLTTLPPAVSSAPLPWPVLQAAERSEIVVAEEKSAETDLCTEIAVPLLVRDRLSGVLDIWDRCEQPLNQVTLDTLSTLAAQITIALENARLFEEVQQTASRLQVLSHQLVEVQEKERRQIARELHDEIGQCLTSLKLTLEMVGRQPPEQLQSGVQEALRQVNDLIARVRELSLNLRPSILDDLGLLPALLWHFERYTAQTQIQVDFKQSGLEQRLPANLETAIYRIIQEALTNVARHARVSAVTVRIWCEEQTLRLHIVDHGVGFDPNAVLMQGGSNGLSGILERARLLGGELTIASQPGAGTRLTALLPLRTTQRFYVPPVL